MDYTIIRLTDRPEIKIQAAQWFHEKWDIPLEDKRKTKELSCGSSLVFLFQY